MERKKKKRKWKSVVVRCNIDGHLGIVAKVAGNKVYCWWGKTFEKCKGKRMKNPKGESLEDGYKNGSSRTSWVDKNAVKVLKGELP